MTKKEKQTLIGCSCKLCVLSRRFDAICKKLSEEDASFLTEFYERYLNESEDLDWIRSGLGGQYFSRNDLKKAFGLTDDQLNDLAKKNRETCNEQI